MKASPIFFTDKTTNPHNWFTDRPAPVLILDRAETLALIHNPGDFLESGDKWRVKSTYICDLIHELGMTGFVYNTTAMRAVEKDNGLPEQGDNGSVLSLLVYNAQGYHRGDKLVADGWIPGSQEMLEQAFRTGKQIRVCGENILGGSVCESLKVRKIGEKFYAMRPHKRKYAVNTAGRPCKIVGEAPKINPQPDQPDLLAA